MISQPELFQRVHQVSGNNFLVMGCYLARCPFSLTPFSLGHAHCKFAMDMKWLFPLHKSCFTIYFACGFSFLEILNLVNLVEEAHGNEGGSDTNLFISFPPPPLFFSFFLFFFLFLNHIPSENGQALIIFLVFEPLKKGYEKVYFQKSQPNSVNKLTYI